MKFLLKLVPNKIKILLLNVLYKDIAGKGTCGDTELAHINKDEALLLKLAGGSGTINEHTGLRQYGKGGGGSAPAPAPAPATPANTTTTQREAPEIEARKLALFDEAIDLATVPIPVPEYQIAGASPLQQQQFQAASDLGNVGQQAFQEGIASILGTQQLALQGPDIMRFMNPYQSYVTDEINRQADIGRNQLANQAIQAGAFGGGREGVAIGELERGRLSQIGLAQREGYESAVRAAQTQQGQMLTAGLQGASELGRLGAAQAQTGATAAQEMARAGAVQQQLAQQALTAQRQTEVARAYEPYQRIEFQKGIMTALPTAASTVTQTTAPGVDPLAKAASTGLGAYAAYQLLRNTGN
jgi:hypothetical protein